MLMISNAAKRRWELWHFDRQSHVACPRSLPLVNLLARHSPAVCVFVCACLLLPKITFRLLIKHQFSWQFNYKVRETQGQSRVKRVASCVDINSLQFAGHLLKQIYRINALFNIVCATKCLPVCLCGTCGTPRGRKQTTNCRPIKFD